MMDIEAFWRSNCPLLTPFHRPQDRCSCSASAKAPGPGSRRKRHGTITLLIPRRSVSRSDHSHRETAIARRMAALPETDRSRDAETRGRASDRRCSGCEVSTGRRLRHSRATVLRFRVYSGPRSATVQRTKSQESWRRKSCRGIVGEHYSVPAHP
jgi:hypothetical protein